MKIIAFTLSFIVVLTVSCSRSDKKAEMNPSACKWVDLTYSFDSTTLYWPNNPLGFEHRTEFKGKTGGGYFYSSYSVCAPEHGGTHLDAPVHFAEGKQTVDQIPLDNLCGEAILVDVSEKALSNRDYLISVSDLLDWEKAHGLIPEATIILFKTGFGAFYPDRLRYFGTDKKGLEAIPELHFPGLSAEAAKWLCARKAKAVGLDTPSLDFGQSKDFMAHRILLGANIPGFENVASLEKLPQKNFSIMALPMKIGSGSGAPLRIVACLH